MSPLPPSRIDRDTLCRFPRNRSSREAGALCCCPISPSPGIGGPGDFWEQTHRACPRSKALADRHYNRQKPESPQFVPPGRCIVLLAHDQSALWVTSWPYARYVKHAWAGAWMNSCFRNEGGWLASDLIRSAVAVTRGIYGEPPEQGFVSFVSPKHVPATPVRGQRIYGYCYLKAGWRHVGFTKGGLWAWQLLPDEMPPPVIIGGSQGDLFTRLCEFKGTFGTREVSGNQRYKSSNSATDGTDIGVAAPFDVFALSLPVHAKTIASQGTNKNAEEGYERDGRC